MITFLNNQKGVTLIELIISIGLGIIITASSLQVFLTIKQIFLTQQALARIQENARMVSDILGNAVKTSGNIGCSSFREDISFHISPDIDSHYFGLLPYQRIIGVKKELDKKILQRVSPESDIIWIKSVRKNYPLRKATNGDDGYVLLHGSPRLKGGEVMAISDCSHVDFFKVKKKSEEANHIISKIIFTNGFHFSKYFQDGAQVGIVGSKLFYIGDTGRINSNGNSIMALYSTDLNGRTLELIEGAEFLDVLYGIDNNREISYLKQSDIKDWKNVVKIKVKILLNSIEDGLIEPKKYEINQVQVMPRDRLMRMWWSYEWPIKGLAA
ncbi:MAG: PilW family protein [Gammaproteobacteria bacterium]|jgi:type IV pilus assembly protein PilW|nr:PilW family protein [Gammaproteobacteria bacterium]